MPTRRTANPSSVRYNSRKDPRRRPRRQQRGRFNRRSRLAIAGVVAAVIIVVAGMLASSYCQMDGNRLKACDAWRTTLRQACIDCKVDTKWTDALVALMAVESGGDTDVVSVRGVKNDIMQAAEGAYGDIVVGGSSTYAVDAQTPEASIYAGVLEFKQNYKLWKKYLKGIDTGEYGEIQLLVQGYNFGADGWYAWCKEKGITSYTLEAAQEYSDTQMPEGAKGTPTHGEKWLGYYEMLRG